MRENDVEAEQIDYARKPLDADAVRGIVKAAGSVGAVLNRRHELAKKRGWVDAPPSVEELVKAVASDPNLLRRPIFLRGSTVLVGFDKTNREAWQKL